MNQKGYLIRLPYDLKPSGGGVMKVVENLINQISLDDSWFPMLLINDWQYKKSEIVQDKGLIKVYKRIRRFVIKNAPIKSIFIYMVSLPAFIVFFSGLVRKYNIGVVNVHYPSESVISLAVARLVFQRKFKFVLSYHWCRFS